MTVYERLIEAKRGLLDRCPNFPKTLVVLGSGLGSFLDDLTIEREISYNEIPHFKSSTVAGHAGRLVIAKHGDHRIACMQGRLHTYEGYSFADVVFPFRTFALAGAEQFLLTNAAGGLNPDFHPGELVLIRDHINLMGSNPLSGPNIEQLGPRFPDMTQVYDVKLNQIILDSALKLKLEMKQGVYVALEGPCYETPSEVKMYRMFGGDMIGMSTVPEALALRHMGKRVAGISCVTNPAAGVSKTPLSHEEVLETANRVRAVFASLLLEVVNRL